MKKRYLFITLLLAFVSVKAQDKILSVTLDETSMVSNQGEGGLYFSGTRNINYRFSSRISPHGDCIDIVNGYAFVTWYKGDINARNLMLSRKNINEPNSSWVTIEFPHRHVGQAGELEKGTGIRGDSHNTAAVGVSTIDGTVHMIYDLHGYSRTSLPNHFFNYSVSKPNIAFAPDSEFTLSNFLPKKNELKAGQNYQRLTYPFLHRADDGSLIARYRVGGSGNGDILMARYDGNVWSNNWLYQDGTIPLPNRNSYYGGERFINGKFYAGFSVRHANNNSATPTNGYAFNSGLYYAYTNGIPSPSSQWFNVNGNPVNMPIKNSLNPSLDPVQFAQPGDDHGTATSPRTTADPSWTVTENGSIHFITRVDNINVHYYKGPNDTTFFTNAAGNIPNPQVRGKMFSYKNNVFMVELINGNVLVKSTPEGKDAWNTVYRLSTNIKYKHFNAEVVDNKLYVYLMQNISDNDPVTGSKRSLYFQQLTLSEQDNIDPVPTRIGEPVLLEGTEEPTSDDIGEVIIKIEAEDYDIGSQNETYFDKSTGNEGAVYRTDDVDIEANASASNGFSIYRFEGSEWLQYTFNSNTAGEFDLVLTTANRNQDNSFMKVELNGTLYDNIPIQRTNDWQVFAPNVVKRVILNQGTNVLRVTQITSQSSTLDKIEFASANTLSNTDFQLQNIVVYPNPSNNGVFKISSPYPDLEYRLTNIQGQLLNTGKVLNKEVNFSKFNKGIYFLQLFSDNKKSVTKIIIN